MPKRNVSQSAGRYKDANWELPAPRRRDGLGLEPDEIQVALLMDLRDGLKEANRHLARIAAGTATGSKAGSKARRRQE
jgi:hypothetical protein